VDQALRLSQLYESSWPGTDHASLERRKSRLISRHMRETAARGRGRHRYAGARRDIS
jgi:hypothetical protein